MLIYLAGPYRANDQCPDEELNIQNAQIVAVKLWESGYHVITPHLNTLHFDHFTDKLTQNIILGGDCDIISRCDAVIFLPGWDHSVGCGIEKAYAEKNHIPITYWPALPEIPKAEETSPIQCAAFRNRVMGMYRLHVTKNSDYSPANIMGTGEHGIVVRLWDKMARLMNLLGFKVEASYHSYEAPRAPKHESIEDTYMDMAVYALIGLLYRADQWGK
jgi:hypothetical protein